ncbi:MAG TPA: DMT family transporter [Bacteroidota bacterium]
MTEESSQRGERSPEALLLVVVFIWASNFPIAKYAIGGLDVFLFNAIRFVVAFVIFAALFRVLGGWRTVERADWRTMAGVGFLAHVVYQLAFIFGLKYTTAGNSALLLSTTPLWTAFFNAKLYNEVIKRQVWLGMAMSLAGITFIIIGSGRRIAFGDSAIWGDLLTLVAAMLWALSTNLQKPLLAKYSSMQLSVVMIGVGAVAHTLISVPDALSLQWESLHPMYYAAGIVSGALTIGVANVLWSYGVKRLGPSRTANFSNLVPVLAFIFSYLTLNEPVSLLQVVGGAITVTGIWVARR